MTQGIYEIANLHDGKASSYVGSSVDVKKRWAEHVRALRRGEHVNSHLQHAWSKYGEGGFSFCVLERVADRANLLAREQYFLDRAFEVGDTYNIVNVACCPPSARGRVVSEETRRKIGEANKGRVPWSKGKKLGPMSEEHKRKLSEALKGYRHTEEAKRKLIVPHVRPYPAFRHRDTSEVIPAGVNLSAMCRERGLNRSRMSDVKLGARPHHKGWALL